MSDKKSVFESHDLHHSIEENGEQKYTGPERRKDDRRKTQDRRTEVRFDPGKQDRRQKQGRRKGDKTPKFW
ncbi:hypothetical protein FV139_19955 [Parahaliea maris]|uniref:Uncharacterized protein n=1 Tax=Parahaliea maris TaxID=2716870 RepID=A0A5C8ZP75_9GAMM|nr:hypothetical protein [Parahaliea maris]TXS89564.1 hypothetical protein FV139_19955 [Parahaliea maris]